MRLSRARCVQACVCACVRARCLVQERTLQQQLKFCGTGQTSIVLSLTFMGTEEERERGMLARLTLLGEACLELALRRRHHQHLEPRPLNPTRYPRIRSVRALVRQCACTCARERAGTVASVCETPESVMPMKSRWPGASISMQFSAERGAPPESKRPGGRRAGAITQ